MAIGHGRLLLADPQPACAAARPGKELGSDHASILRDESTCPGASLQYLRQAP